MDGKEKGVESIKSPLPPDLKPPLKERKNN